MTLQREFLLLFLLTPIVLSHETGTENTLLLGGDTILQISTTSMELVTDTGVCTPKLPPIPVGRQSAAAVLIDRKILYCGGIDRGDSGHYGGYHGSCHSYQLGGGERTYWKEEPGMVSVRSEFSLSLVGNTVYAIGGRYQDTVESYTEEGGWKLEEDMVMDKYRSSHCSIVWDQDIVILGGEHRSGPFNSVQAIDTSNKTVGWRSMESMETPRYGHGCHVSTYEGHTGILVAGGWGSGNYVRQVEFYRYNNNSWIQLGSLVTPRYHHSVTVVSGNLVVAGGLNGNDEPLSSIEYFNISNSEWNVGNYLKVGRFGHSSVGVPVKLLDC